MENSNYNNDANELSSEIRDTVKKKNSKQEETSFTAQTENVTELEAGTSDKNEKQYKPSEKWRIMKNIVVISLAFMVHFTAFQGAGNLQSSVNADEGLGTVSLATIYFSLILSNVFLPVVMIRSVAYIVVFLFQENKEIMFIVTQVSNLRVPFRQVILRQCNHKYFEPKFCLPFLHYQCYISSPSQTPLFHHHDNTV
jgi:uncharacterized membrane protein YdbT with pleckstrin-like domain